MGGEVLGGASVDLLGIGVRQLQRHHRRLLQGIRLGAGPAYRCPVCGRCNETPSLAFRQLELRLGARHPMIVIGAVDEAKRAAGCRRGIAHQADMGARVRDQVEAPFGHRVAVAHIGRPARDFLPHRDVLRIGELVLAGDQVHALALRRMGAHDQLAPLRHGKGAETLRPRSHRLAAIGKHDRGHARIDRGGDPGVQPEQRGGDAGRGREGRGEALPAIATGRKHGDHQQDEQA